MASMCSHSQLLLLRLIRGMNRYHLDRRMLLVDMVVIRRLDFRDSSFAKGCLVFQLHSQFDVLSLQPSRLCIGPRKQASRFLCGFLSMHICFFVIRLYLRLASIDPSSETNGSQTCQAHLENLKHQHRNLNLSFLETSDVCEQ